MFLSVVVPVFNEESLVTELVERCTQAAKVALELAGKTALPEYELIIVDDGSTDGTQDILYSLTEKFPTLLILTLSRNFGHQKALLAGIEAATGEWVVTIDGDLQDPPEVIPDLLKTALSSQADVVSARRSSRSGETPFKLMSAFIFYRFLNLLTDVYVPSDVGDFRAMNRRTARILVNASSESIYIRGTLPLLGGKQVTMDYVRDARKSGSTKFSLSKMLRFAGDAITSSSLRPLAISVWLASSSVVVSLVVAIWATVAWTTGSTLAGWASTILVISISSALIFTVLAVQGAYLGRIHRNILRHPRWLVYTTVRHGKTTAAGRIGDSFDA